MTSPGRRTLLALALALAALTLLPGCPAWTRFCKMVYLCSRDRIEIPEAPPPDFEFRLKGDNLKNPPINYFLKIHRNGQAEYSVTFREPSRTVREGRFEVMEDQIVKLWDAIKAADYGEIEERFPSSGDGTDVSWGIQSFMVQSKDYQKEVQAHYLQVPALERIRMTAVSLLPESVIDQVRKDAQGLGTMGTVIGDTATKRFYAPTSPLLKDVPEELRQVFKSMYDALNFGYDPGPDWKTPREGDDK